MLETIRKQRIIVSYKRCCDFGQYSLFPSGYVAKKQKRMQGCNKLNVFKVLLLLHSCYSHKHSVLPNVGRCSLTVLLIYIYVYIHTYIHNLRNMYWPGHLSYVMSNWNKYTYLTDIKSKHEWNNSSCVFSSAFEKDSMYQKLIKSDN